MKILVMAGHTASGNHGCGAVCKKIDESNETRKVGPKVVEYLKELGVESKYIHLDKSKTDDYLKEQVDLANRQGKFDCMVQIHLNCGSDDKDDKTTGTETFYYSDKGKVFAKRVDDKLATLFTDRKIKRNLKYYWLRHTQSPAILCEICFIDDKDDVRVYKENFDKVCRLIAEGLANKDFQKVEQVDKSTTYRIRTGGFTKEEAEENMKYLEGLTNWWMTTKLQEDGSYCIITGGFDKERAEIKLKTLEELTGWWATVEENI